MFSITIAKLIALTTIIVIVFGIALIPLVFFCRTLQRCLNRCSPQSRTMAPGQVWLLLIPLFSLLWQFVVVSRIASSLANEFNRRKMIKDPAPGKSLGLAFCILFVCGLIPIISIFACMAGMVCGILYWIKIAKYSAELSNPIPPEARPIVIP